MCAHGVVTLLLSCHVEAAVEAVVLPGVALITGLRPAGPVGATSLDVGALAAEKRVATRLAEVFTLHLALDVPIMAKGRFACDAIARCVLPEMVVALAAMLSWV